MRRMIVLGLVVALALPTFALATTPQPAHAQGQTVHVVKLGETMYGIAGLYGTSVQAIANANGIVNPNYIYAGQRLVIPGSWSPPHPGPGPKPPPAGCGTYYRVQYGDTMTAIAVRHGTSVQAIANANGIPYPYNWIYAGQSLYIPCPGGPKPPHKPPPRPQATAEGHAGAGAASGRLPAGGADRGAQGAAACKRDDDDRGHGQHRESTILQAGIRRGPCRAGVGL